MEITKLPLNDEYAQNVRCRYLYDTYKKEYEDLRREQISKCNHLFVVLRKSKTIPTVFYTSPEEKFITEKVECIHCGLTNKFFELDREELHNPINDRYLGASIESKIFTEIVPNARNPFGFNNKKLNLISEKILSSDHVSLLYNLALSLNPNGTNEELFDIMTELHNLENTQERLRLRTLEQAGYLLERYKNREAEQVKKYELTKKK